tara:strand:+ start:8043 stop:8324 length:282 start_codon:yes stop_codon:yes gene_type:complete
MAIKTQKRWSSTEVKTLKTLRRRGISFEKISYRLGRSSGSVSQKWETLKNKPTVLDPPKKYTPPKTTTVEVGKKTVESVSLDVKGIKIHMVFS